jgi:hypothetical protein
MKKKLKRIVRKKKLTPKEAAKYQAAVKEEEKMAPQRWSRGYSTWDGERCEAWFNVTNWH